MIPQEVAALFDFIDFLDRNKGDYIQKYIPLCDELERLDARRSALRPSENYRDKQLYDEVQKEIKEKFEPITEHVQLPVLNQLKALGIWSGDDVYTSIWNNNIEAISVFKENFELEDVPIVLAYKNKYLSFRSETNSGFLSLQYVFGCLDEILKSLFDFFKETEENEFEAFETKTIEAKSIEDAFESYIENKGRNVRFSIPQENFFARTYSNPQQRKVPLVINNEITMGDRISVGNISNNKGPIAVGKDNHISILSVERAEFTERIQKLIDLLRKEQNLDDERKQSLITNFDKVREELLEETPDKSRISRWLSNTKRIIGDVVLAHDAQEAVKWIYSSMF